MVKFVGTSAIQAHPVNEFGAIIDGAAIANILQGGTESMVKFTGTSALQYHPVDETGNIIDATAIASEINSAIGNQPPAIPPSTSIEIDATGGDDNNNGFDAPIQTIARLQEILRTYNWASDAVDVDFSNFTEAFTLSLYDVVGLFELELDLNGNTFTSGSFSFEGSRNIGCLRIRRMAIDGNISINLFQCGFVEWAASNALNISNNTLNEIILVTETDYYKVGVTTLTNVACNSLIQIGDNLNFLEVDRLTLNSTSFSAGFISVLGNVSRIVMPSVSAAITGQKFVFDSNASSLCSITDDNSVTETIRSTYLPGVQINGTNIRGVFVDDTAAGAGGLTTGEFYQTSTGELRVKL